MPTIQELESKRDAVLQEMRAIRSMKRGSISEQYLQVRHRGFKEPVARGPYHVFSRREARTGKTVSWRLTSEEAIEKARADVSSYQRFVALCREFQELTETLGELESSCSEQGQEKKRRRLPSSKNPK